MTSQWRQLAEEILDSERLEKIKQFYYTSFNPPSDPKLKFRYVKMFTYNEITKTYQWNYLHRSVRKRSFNPETLKNGIKEIIERGVIPIRIFMSAANWLYPYRIRGIKSKVTRYLTPGIIPIECDSNLDDSITVAKILREKLDGEKVQVYTGNRSIHTWLLYDSKTATTITEDTELREKIFGMAQSLVPIELDRRTTVDTFRVVPIIGSCNGFTMRKVVLWNPNITKEELLAVAEIK